MSPWCKIVFPSYAFPISSPYGVAVVAVVDASSVGTIEGLASIIAVRVAPAQRAVGLAAPANLRRRRRGGDVHSGVFLSFIKEKPRSSGAIK
jgi:hypothetical protein